MEFSCINEELKVPLTGFLNNLPQDLPSALEVTQAKLILDVAGSSQTIGMLDQEN